MFLNTADQSPADALFRSGCALLAAPQLMRRLGDAAVGLGALRDSWSRLPRDLHLRDGGAYRFRRHSCFTHDVAADALTLMPHRAHWQPIDYNALHGGMERWFEPVEPAIASSAAWSQLLRSLGALFVQVRPVPCWYVEAHQFRIDTAEGIGRPTPEGAHRDGVDYVAVILVDRGAVRGGETRVFETQGNAGVRFTMTEPWTTLLLDDARVIHETTPIQPLSEPAARNGVRDTLVLTYRSNGFQAPPA
jgi:hypothetical protein